MRRPRRRPYRGVLAKPLPPRNDPAYDAEFAKRVRALYEFHEVKYGNRNALLVMLILHHVPGFHHPPDLGDLSEMSPLMRAMIAVQRPARGRAKKGYYELLLPKAERFLRDRKGKGPKLGDVALGERFLQQEKVELLKGQRLGLFESLDPGVYDELSAETLSRKLRERRQK